ncbi:phosphopyruvate hydratase [Candidatus Falkowbacteria bacterium]|nr:phosphopyruvate hydratase [Candidatus Falkowbacteria bacterium]
MATIKSIHAREILDSRGNPTVEVELKVEGGAGLPATPASLLAWRAGVASVPSGASTGIYEALELRDGDKKRYGGKGVLKAVRNINETISSAVVGKNLNQRQLDEFLIELDGTKNKTRLGANAILGVSLAFARAAAACPQRQQAGLRGGRAAGGVELYEYLGGLVSNKNFSLPVPMMNIINGGKHADSGLDVQEFMIVPVKFSNFHERLRAGSEIFHTLKEILKKKGYQTGVGDEGGFAPRLPSNEKALDLIMEAIGKAGYKDKVKIGMDVAASSFYEKGIYKLKINGREKKLKSAGLLTWYKKLLAKYPIVSVEDPFAEDDWAAFAEMTKVFGKKIKIVGDDLLVTNSERIKMAISRDAVNSVLIKLNQIGSLSETIDAIQMTQKQGWAPIVSHRSGETEDSFIADLVVGLGAPYIKTGSLSRSERICKYNRLLWIEDRLNA